MDRTKRTLDDLVVTNPCSKNWDGLSGEGAVRFCASCSLHVHDLSAMTRSAAETLMESSEGRVCATFRRHPDGTVATVPERSRWRSWGAAAASILFGFVPLLAGCRKVTSCSGPPTVSDGPDSHGGGAALVDPDVGMEYLRQLGYVGYTMGEAVMQPETASE